MRVQGYVDANGRFDYEKYRKVQEEGNIRKLGSVWADENLIRELSKFALANLDSISFGLCHGTRRGLEQLWFSKYTGGEFLGTEISRTAIQFPNTIQWDFHDVKEEWLESVDVIYSNSWDHSFDPKLCFTNWMRCLRPGGFCFLEHTRQHWEDQISELDPFGISLSELVFLLTEIGMGAFFVRTILSDLLPDRPKHLSRLNVVVVEKANGALVFP
jgi:hypothetical protein